MREKSHDFAFQITESEGVCVAKLTGDLNTYTCVDLRAEMIKKFDAGVSLFILDLEGLLFVDSSGIGVFINFLNMTQKRPGSKMILCNLTSEIRSILEVIGINRIFSISPDLKTAHEALKN